MLIIDINKEEFEKKFNEDKKARKTHPVVFIIAIIAGLLLLYISESFVFTFIVLFIFFLVYHILKARKYTPKVNTLYVSKAAKKMQSDPLSEKTRSDLYIMSNDAKNFTDKVMTDIFMSELYLFRDDIASAINTMNMTDRIKLSVYPEAALLYYHDLIMFYYSAGDMQSVLNVYCDAQPVFERQMHTDFVSLFNVADSMVYVNSAAGEYQKALDLMNTKNQYSYIMNSKKRHSVMSQMIRSLIFIETAELYYKCGQTENARQWLDSAAGYTNMCPHNTRRADELRKKL